MDSALTPVTVYTYVNDTAPSLNFTIKREDVGIVDISGATVNFYIQNPYNKVRTNTGHTICRITDPENGKCSYDWAVGDIPDEGIYDANLRILYASGQVETAPVTIEVASIV